MRVLLRGSSAPAIVRYTGGASALKVSVVAGRRWTPVWVALRREPGARMCVAHFEPASMVDIGTIAHVGAIGPHAANRSALKSPRPRRTAALLAAKLSQARVGVAVG